MKKTLFIIVIFLASCSKDFLVRDPLDKITDVSLTYTADECMLYVNKYYTDFWGSPTSYIYHNDLGTDNLLGVNYDQNPYLIDGLVTVPSTGGGWSDVEWGKIRSVNFLLDNYQKSDEIDQALPFIGEARFFRAFYYFEQFLKKFGGAPWISTELNLNSEELLAPRLPRNQLADSILADLDWAIAELPSQNIQQKGRISKEVAELYKARIALYEGTWEKYHAGTPFAGAGNPVTYFEAARDAAKAVMSSGLFSLDNVGVEDGYYMLFNQHDYSNSKEIMLWKQFDRTQGLWHSDNRNPGRNGAGVGLTRSLVESYLCKDGKPIAVSNEYQGDQNLLNVIANRDPRLSQTMFTPGRARTIVNGRDTTIIFTKSNINLTDVEKCSTGYELAKGADADADEQVTVTGSIKGSIIFRYAEALLIYAESRTELGEITQADLDETINKLRDRVGMPHLTLTVGYSDPNGAFTAARGYQGVPVSNLLQEVRRERRIELSCEGFRYDDLMRWAAANLLNHDKIEGAKTGQFKNLTWLKNYFSKAWIPTAITGGHDNFMASVDQWTPPCTEGINYWTDDEGYFAPYQRNITSNHFTFDPDKCYLNPIPSDQFILNKNLVQNPGWPNK